MTRRLLPVLAVALALAACSSAGTASTPAADPTTAADTTPAATTAATTVVPTTAVPTPSAPSTAPPTTAPDTTLVDSSTPPTASPVEQLLARGKVFVAHDGGGAEAPPDTLYALKRGHALGADVLDMNVLLTKDGQLVVGHDGTVDRTTNGNGAILDKTLAEVQALDAAYWWTPGGDTPRDRPASAYPYRGVRTGQKPPPAGATPEDFAMPTFQQVVDAFPGAVFGVEMEQESGPTIVPALVEAIKKNGLEGRVVVSSFGDDLMEAFTAAMPGVAASPGPKALLGFKADPKPMPAYRVAQIPPRYGDLVISDADIAALTRNGLPVWIWPNDATLENEAAYRTFLARGANGVNADRPSEMAKLVQGR